MQLVSLALLAAAFSASFVQEKETVKERESGHKYDVEATILGSDKVGHVTGTGIREKTVFAVNVYSFALYVEPTKAQELLAPAGETRGHAARETQGQAMNGVGAAHTPEITTVMRDLMNYLDRRLALVIPIAALCAVHGWAWPGPSQQSAVEDPAPPVVREPSAARPVPKAQAALVRGATARALTEGATVEDWPQLHGPQHDGVCREAPLAARFAESGPPLVWRLATGEGYAAPSALAGELVLFHRVGDEEVIDCLVAETGQRRWRLGYPCGYLDEFGYSTGPKCSPLLEGEYGWTYGIEGVLSAFHLPSGTLLWRRDLMREFEVPKGFFGVGATPLLAGDELILNLGVPGGPCVAAFDKRTGKLVWGTGKNYLASYSTPALARIAGRDKVLVFAGGKLRPPQGGLLVIDLEDHTVDVDFPWRSRTYYSVNASTPIVRGADVFLSEAYGLGAVRLALRADDETGALEATSVWKNERFDMHWHTPLTLDGHLYGFAGQGERAAELVCVDWETGATRWRNPLTFEQELEGQNGLRKVQRGVYRGALLHTHLGTLCLGEWGDLLVLDLSPKGAEVRAQTKLFEADQTWSLPLIHRGLLYVCQNTQDRARGTPPSLRCYDLRGES